MYLDINPKIFASLSYLFEKNEDGSDNIKFVTGHCSTFVIYTRTVKMPENDETGNSVEYIDDRGAASELSANGTWQSLNKKVYGISSKWFIIIILVALALVLVLYKPGKRKNK